MCIKTSLDWYENVYLYEKWILNEYQQNTEEFCNLYLY